MIKVEIREGDQKRNPNTIQQDAWKSEITTENISPQTPEELWGTITLMALRQIVDVSETVEEVVGRTALWDKANNPHLPIAFLMAKTFWVLRNWKPNLE